MRKTTPSGGSAALVLAIVLGCATALPLPSRADIYRWEDDRGTVHFTDDLGNIPAKFRGHQRPILKGPPSATTPSVSTFGSPPAAAQPPEPASTEPPATQASTETDELAGQTEQLKAKIAAKEKFVETIDRKRSNIRNPLGNRFVSPEDLELYRKYSAELPQDREQLRDLESRLRAIK
jgi:Domain of unknown function (DUF4124)